MTDGALARRLTAIEVAELAPDEAVLALERVAPAFERHHGVRFTPDAIAAAVAWSARYIPDGRCPTRPSACSISRARAPGGGASASSGASRSPRW